MKPLIDQATWQAALYVLLSLTVVRIVPVAVAMLGTRSSPATVAYMGWFGPRGLASIVFAVLVVEAHTPHAGTIADTAALTVIASMLLHGLTAGPLTRRYVGLLQRRPRNTGIEIAATTVRVPPAGARWPESARP